MKKPTISKLKKEVWKLFSEYIRRRNADFHGNVRCITCGKIYHYKKLHAGHFIPGRHNAVLFHEDLVWPQCYHCNVGLYGNSRMYDAFMRKKYGDEKVEEFDKLHKYKSGVKQFTIEELERLKEKYKQKLSEL